MAEAVVDPNVVYAARMMRDQYHESGSAIVEAMDTGDLPRGRVTNYGLTEVLNPIQHRAGDEPARQTLEFLTESRGFRLRHLAADDFRRGRAILRRESDIELTDAITTAYMQRTDVEYVYSFDDDFDRFDDVVRLDTATNPYEP